MKNAVLTEGLNGLDAQQSAVVVDKLNTLLSSYQFYYQNLRGFHWNIKGKAFFSLHEKFEGLYDEAAGTIDELAERILTLGGRPLHSFAEYTEQTYIKALLDISDGEEAVKAVIDNNQELLGQLRGLLELAGENNDEGTASLASGLIEGIEKTIWMFRAWLA
ncbi:Dps family protein [Flammeovirgaceae bacterium SG7u.111]|nr:Dps family protein [Flammeovirgaceae bacterium SG7u.132]WPO36292.1 Dps family protein [Flammeovirgaceae bacterium SG7u.111]